MHSRFSSAMQMQSRKNQLKLSTPVSVIWLLQIRAFSYRQLGLG
jgi:hypothetical protein